ncbi:GNAT family N-acetyltransferase [Sphingomonas bacterium]|uniref:GNAT family N-acetyltransferase n=1 Tax=Sphingomonas bacterium TaxID=1895847 RepID=UPI00157529FD|nr:GNAT family N-acetyltransferase [Sphingomonas bacterium]
MALIAVAPGELATIVTTLEMTARPPLRPMPSSPLRLVRWNQPEPAKYRTLFARVGARWLWYSRLALDDDALAAIVQDPAIAVHAVLDRAGIEVGMVELDHRTAGACAIAYFALVPELAGQRHGRWLMAETLARAWRPGVARVWLNTCTLDHPSALGFYRAQGFTATARTIETFADPRASGLLPADAAPQIPYLASRR